jgi:predicted transposase/invertase (TIGR01784 family)
MAESSFKNPHDCFFKELFARKENARDFLQRYLPPDLVALLDLASLEITKDSFIDPDLQTHFSDLLYKVGLQDQGQTLIYVLFEHKSFPERYVALQLLGYMVRIWEQALHQNQPLLPILPLVFYHGRYRWTIAENFRALFKTPVALEPYLPEYNYLLYDLSRYKDEELQGAEILRAQLLLLKYIFRRELKERLPDILALVEQQGSQEALIAMLSYVASGTEQVTRDDLKEIVEELLEKGGEVMPTIAEQWLEEGRQEGLKEGLKEGLEQGLEQGREEGREAALKLLRRFLARRFGAALDQFDERLKGLDLAAIDGLSEAAFEAESLADFEAALANLQPSASDSSASN